MRNHGRSLVGYLLRFSRVILPLNPSRVKITCLFAFHCWRILRSEGRTGLILRLKTYSVLLMQAVGRHRVQDTLPLGARVGRTRKGLPRIIPRFERARIMKGEARVIRWWLSMFLLYRFIDGRHPEPSFATITTRSKAKVNDWHPKGVPFHFWFSLIRLIESPSTQAARLADARPVIDSIKEYYAESKWVWDPPVGVPPFWPSDICRPNWEMLLSRRFFSVLGHTLADAIAPARTLLEKVLEIYFPYPPVQESVLRGAPAFKVGRKITSLFESFNFSPVPLVKSAPTSFRGSVKTTSMSMWSVVSTLSTLRAFCSNYCWNRIPVGLWEKIPKEYPLEDSRSATSLVRWLAMLEPTSILTPPTMGRFWSFNGRMHHLLDVKGPVVEALGRLGLKLEPAGKVRVFAMVDPFTQWALLPLHKLLFKILRWIPQDGTFDQTAPLLRLKKLYPPKHKFYSLDLSAATDRLPIDLQRELLRPLIGDLPASLWQSILVDRTYVAQYAVRDGNIVQGGEPRKKACRYAAGQPMGALSSWAMLAMTHHAIVQHAHWLAYQSPKWFTGYAILGDDIVIGDEKVAKIYLALMKRYDVGINLSKSLIGSCLEFAKRFHTREDCSPVSFKDWWVAQNSLAGAIEFIRKWRPSIAAFLFSSGWGYKSVGRLYKPFWGKRRSSIRARNFLLALTSPVSVFPLPILEWITSPRFGVPGKPEPEILYRAIRDEMRRLRDHFSSIQVKLDRYEQAYLAGVGVIQEDVASLLHIWDPESPAMDVPRHVLHGLNFYLYYPIVEVLFKEFKVLVEESKVLQSKIEATYPVQDLTDLDKIFDLRARLDALMDPDQFHILKEDTRPPKVKYLTALNRWIQLYHRPNFLKLVRK